MTDFAFSFADVYREIESIKALARPFLERTAGDVLSDLRAQLDGIKSDRNRTNAWTIPLDRPLLTKPCNGAYQRGSRGGHNVYAEISAKWEIQPKNNNPVQFFEITGNASCRVRLLEAGEGHELGRFNVDIGRDDGPGAIFHTQVSGQVAGEAFPSTLDVPRLPMLPLTPLGVVDYVLGELFQDEWLRRVAGGSEGGAIWSGLQRRRLVNFLDWQLQILCGRRGDISASPLMDLKRAGAAGDLFLDRFARSFAPRS